MSGKLVTFGCSYTHGPWLPDTLVDPWKKPSNFAWPKILSILLKRECENRAVGGSGKLEILWISSPTKKQTFYQKMEL